MTLCRLRTHQWCFILCNVLLFHLLLFGADLLEQYFLQSLPLSYTDAKALEIRDRARKLDLDPLEANLSSRSSSAVTCSNQEIFLLIVVCSSPENRTRRDAIRQTWGNATASRAYSVLTVFAVGKAASASTQLEVQEEAQRHRDIIEGSFIDSPQTQTQKMLMSVEWTVIFCPRARFILHTAQDVFVGVPSLAGYLQSLAQQEDIYLGRRAGISARHSSRFAGDKHISYNPCCYKFIFTSSAMREDELFTDWKETSDGEDCSLLQTYYSLVSCKVLTYIDNFKQFSLDRIKNELLHFVN
ncbi:hypothetical protein EK904_010216 [Melospiza melodia maxima]|nr:hypothetical protein EK904_010216 [Melospiza melodia maxima]